MPTALRPLSTGELLDRSFSLYRNNFVLFLGIAAIPHLLILLLQALPLLMSSLMAFGTGAGQAAVLVTAMVAGLGTLVAYIVVIAVAQAATVFAVSARHLDQSITIREAFGKVKGHVGQIVGVMISVGLRVLLGCLLLIIPGIWLMLRYSVAVPASMLEDLNVQASLDRSSALTEGSRGRIFVIYFLVWILTFVLAMVGAVAATFAGLQAGRQLGPQAMILQYLITFVTNSLVFPLLYIALSLVYYDQRVRKEAFDIQHMMTMLGGAAAPNAASAGGGMGISG